MAFVILTFIVFVSSLQNMSAECFGVSHCVSCV